MVQPLATKAPLRRKPPLRSACPYTTASPSTLRREESAAGPYTVRAALAGEGVPRATHKLPERMTGEGFPVGLRARRV